MKPIDFLDADLLRDPYPTYAALRAEAPAYWSDQLQAFVLTRFEDVRGALQNHEVFSSNRLPKLIDSHVQREADRLGVFSGLVKPVFHWVGMRKLKPFVDIASRFMWQRDPPEHTRLRRLMHKAFLNSETSRLRPRVEGLVDQLIETMGTDGTCDYMDAFAIPLPAMIIAEIFGIPEDWDKIKDWADDIKVYLGGAASKKARDEALQSILSMRGFFEGVIEKRRAEPQDDFITALCEADGFTDDTELIANIIVTIGAGQVTTQDMLGNGLLALLRHPDQLQQLRDDPDRIATAIDEMLRYDGPVQLTQRVTLSEVEVSGTRIPEGSLVYLIRGSANRDGEQWEHPDVFDIARENTRHVAFGAGIHYCIGAALARLEGEVAFRRLLETFGSITLAGEPEWRCDNLQFRGLQSLPLALQRTQQSSVKPVALTGGAEASM